MTYNNIARAKMVEKRNKQFVLSINSTLNDDLSLIHI